MDPIARMTWQYISVNKITMALVHSYYSENLLAPQTSMGKPPIVATLSLNHVINSIGNLVFYSIFHKIRGKGKYP